MRSTCSKVNMVKWIIPVKLFNCLCAKDPRLHTLIFTVSVSHDVVLLCCDQTSPLLQNKRFQWGLQTEPPISHTWNKTVECRLCSSLLSVRDRNHQTVLPPSLRRTAEMCVCTLTSQILSCSFSSPGFDVLMVCMKVLRVTVRTVDVIHIHLFH